MLCGILNCSPETLISDMLFFVCFQRFHLNWLLRLRWRGNNISVAIFMYHSRVQSVHMQVSAENQRSYKNVNFTVQLQHRLFAVLQWQGRKAIGRSSYLPRVASINLLQRDSDWKCFARWLTTFWRSRTLNVHFGVNCGMKCKLLTAWIILEAFGKNGDWRETCWNRMPGTSCNKKQTNNSGLAKLP